MHGRPPTSERPSTRRPNPTAAFAAECGLRGPLRFMVENTESGQTQTFDVYEPFVLIGQSPGCHLRLLHPDVSYRHAYCQVVQGHLYVYDLDTEHGTVWGAGVRREGSLTPDSRLQIGPFIVRLSRAPAFTCSLQPTAEDWEPQNEPLEDVRLWFENATGRSSHSALRPLRRQITLLGRSNRCHLKLSDPSVSKAHCAIVRTEVGYWVVDLLGRAGTTLNGQSVRFSGMRVDDCIGVGRFRMKLRELVPSEGLEAPAAGTETAHELPIAAQASERAEAPTIVLPPVPVSVSVTDEHLAQSRQSLAFHAARLPSLPPPDAERGTSDALILAMMEQFSLLQQQLLTHTQQQMSMLTEMFATLHKAQNEAVMSQLQRIQEITTELNSLRAQSGSSRVETAAPDTGGPPAIPQPAAGDAMELSSPHDATAVSEPREQSVPVADQRFRQSADESSVSSSEPVAGAEAGGVGSADDALPAVAVNGFAAADDSDVVPVAAPDPAPAEPVDEVASVGSDSPPKARPRPPVSGRFDSTAHARLTMRISELERERKGSWKKLMQLVGGVLDE